jgi:hypothetical protein
MIDRCNEGPKTSNNNVHNDWTFFVAKLCKVHDEAGRDLKVTLW